MHFVCLCLFVARNPRGFAHYGRSADNSTFYEMNKSAIRLVLRRHCRYLRLKQGTILSQSISNLSI